MDRRKAGEFFSSVTGNVYRKFTPIADCPGMYYAINVLDGEMYRVPEGNIQRIEKIA